MKVDHLLKNARVQNRDKFVDIALNNGVIESITPDINASGLETWDLEGRVVLPGLIDAHVHLDKTYLPLQNASGTLREAIDVWGAHKAELDATSYEKRALRAVREAALNGTIRVRTHVDIDPNGGFTALEAILGVRERVKDVLELQVVALGKPGGSAAQTEAMRTALGLGADLVGGAPALSDDPQQCIDTVFDLAEAFGKAIDLHIDETEDPSVRTLEYLAEQTVARGLQGRVTAGHCCSLAFIPDDEATRIIDKVAAAELDIVTLPSCNLVLMGRTGQPTPRGLTRVKDLLEAGVNVAAASDNVHDPFNPFGHYDPLFTANLCAHAAHLTSSEEIKTSLDLVTKNAAKLMNRQAALKVGTEANLVVLDTVETEEAVTHLPARLATFYQGRLVVRQTHTQAWTMGEALWI